MGPQRGQRSDCAKPWKSCEGLIADLREMEKHGKTFLSRSVMIRFVL